MLKFCLLILLINFVQAQEVFDICNNTGRILHNIDRFVLRSQNYPDEYSHNLLCTFEMTTFDLPLIVTLDFVDFHIEEEVICGFDYLCVNDARFCGMQSGTFEFLVPQLSNFTVIFVTDFVVSERGFEISVSTRPAGNEAISQVVGGLGNGLSTPRFLTEEVTYSSAYVANYRNRTTCNTAQTPNFTTFFALPFSQVSYFPITTTGTPPSTQPRTSKTVFVPLDENSTHPTTTTSTSTFYPIHTSTTSARPIFGTRNDNPTPGCSCDMGMIRQAREFLMEAEGKISSAKSLLRHL